MQRYKILWADDEIELLKPWEKSFHMRSIQCKEIQVLT